MPENHYVIVGNGPSGNEAAFVLRDLEPDARITLINKGKGSCYSLDLLPDYIAGKIEEEDLDSPPLDSYKEKNIKLRCRQEAVGLDLQNQRLFLDHKEIVPFDGLILAVGTKPSIPVRMAAFQKSMLTLNTLEDAKEWKEKLQQTQSVFMIGGDLASLSVTKALINLKKKVYFLLYENAFWPLRWNEILSSMVADSLRERGVEVLESQSLKNIEQLPDGNCRVDLEGTTLVAGIVGAFFEYVPDVQFLIGSGLHIDRGILVDKHLYTGFPGVYATGDCAQIFHPEINDYWCSIGRENAQILGRIAAINLAGGGIKTDAEPSSIFNVKGININTSWWAEF